MEAWTCHPFSNGLAERVVEIFKLGIRKQLTGMLQTKLSRFLFHYRLTPNAITGVAQAKLLLTRRPRSHLDSCTVENKMQQQQHNQKVQHDKHSKSHHFKQVDLVFIHDFHRGAAKPTWLPGTVTVDQIMRLNYVTITLFERHADLIHTCGSDCETCRSHPYL